MAEGHRWIGRSRPSEGLRSRSRLVMFPRILYGQTLPVSCSSLGGRESPLWKTPSWASPSEREEARGLGLTRQTPLPSHDWCLPGRVLGNGQIASDRAFGAGARLQAEEETWPYKLDPVNWEVPGNQTQTQL